METSARSRQGKNVLHEPSRGFLITVRADGDFLQQSLVDIGDFFYTELCSFCPGVDSS